MTFGGENCARQSDVVVIIIVLEERTAPCCVHPSSFRSLLAEGLRGTGWTWHVIRGVSYIRVEDGDSAVRQTLSFRLVFCR